MPVNSLLLNTKTLTISKGSPLNSDALTSYTEAVALDLAAISTIINDNLVPIVNGLNAADGIDPIDNTKVDGAQLFVDNDATANTDGGIFYDADLGAGGRPITIKEALNVIVQLISRNAATNVSSYTEEFTLGATEINAGYIQLTDPLNGGIISSSTTFKVFYCPNGTDAYRLPSTKYTVDTSLKRISPAGGFSFVLGDVFIIDYQTIDLSI